MTALAKARCFVLLLVRAVERGQLNFVGTVRRRTAQGF